ncbi:MAG: SH3 domain-containing protein, partial [Candidatus Scalindua sp.]
MNSFEYILKQYRIWQDIVDSPAQRLIREMEYQRKHIQPLIDTAQRVKEVEKYYIDNSTLSYIQNLKNEYSKWHTAFNALSIPDFQDQLRSVIDNIKLPALHSIAYEWQKALDDDSALQKFSQSFGGQIIEQLHQITSTENKNHIGQQVEYLDKLLVDQLSHLPTSRLSKETVIQIMLSIIIFVLAFFNSMQLEDNINSRIEDLEEVVLEKLHGTEERLLERFEELHSAEDKNLYVAIDHVNLRSEPSTGSNVIHILSPNMIVEVIGKEGHWFNIQYF